MTVVEQAILYPRCIRDHCPDKTSNLSNRRVFCVFNTLTGTLNLTAFVFVHTHCHIPRVNDQS